MTPDDTPTPAPDTLAKTFDPAAIEARWYAHWEDNGLFRPERPNAVPFTIVNPPPNVTGSLHIGHALDNTLQDVVVRYERLRGKDALWVVGTDHAGIATQMVVERELEKAQDKRTNYTLSLHDALPICRAVAHNGRQRPAACCRARGRCGATR